MHEATQRRLYRILFIGLAISPMLFVVTVAAYRQSAWRIAGMEKQLTSRLGLKVQISGLTHPLPFHTDVEQVVLSDPDTLERVGSIDGLRIQQTNRGLQISAQTASVDASGQESLWRCVHESLLRSPAIDCCYAAGQIQDLVVFSDVSGQRFEQNLHSVRIEYDRLCDAIGPQIAGPQIAGPQVAGPNVRAEHREWKENGTGDLVGRSLRCQFQTIAATDDTQDSRQGRLEVYRATRTLHPVTVVLLDCRQTPLSVAATFPAWQRTAGSACTLSGLLEWRLDAVSTLTARNVAIAQVDLATASAPLLPGRADGTATLHVDQAFRYGPQWERVDGTVQLEQFRPSGTLLKAFQGAQVLANRKTFAFRWNQLGLHVDADGQTQRIDTNEVIRSLLVPLAAGKTDRQNVATRLSRILPRSGIRN